MRAVAAFVTGAVCLAGCNAILGLDAGEPAETAASASAGGAASAASAGGATSSVTGSGGNGASGGGTSTGGATSSSSTTSGEGGSVSSVSSAGGAGGSGGTSACTGCGVGESCDEDSGLCHCGTEDAAAGFDEEACPDDSAYSECVSDALGTRCGCDTGTCHGDFVCDLPSHECFCSDMGCGPATYCWPANSGALTGKCLVDDATCSYGEVNDGGICTCDALIASCED